MLNNGTKTFTLKYGFNPRFFRKHYLKGDGIKIFDRELSEPKLSFRLLIEYTINKLKFFYYKISN